jgi:hypothetical protein
VLSEPATTIPFAAKLLGFLGLAPFLLLSMALWVAPAALSPVLHAALLGYGLAIASFMGGVQWGFGIARDLEPRQQARVLAQSVVPALVAWFGVLLPFPYPYVGLIAAFVLVVLVDFRLVAERIAPAWYPLLRVPLTAGVLVALVGGLLHVLLA